MRRIQNEADAEESGAYELRGWIHNLTWSRDEIREWTEAGRLYLQEVPGGRLWFNCGEGRNQLYFQIMPELFVPLDLQSVYPCVSELIYLSDHSQKSEAGREALRKLGFLLQTEALSMIYTRGEETLLEIGQMPKREEMPVIQGLYRECFDSLVDAAPGAEELQGAFLSGELRVIRNGEGTIAGCLMLQRQGRRMLVRHVATVPAERGKGFGTAMMRGAMAELHSGEKAMLWVRRENESAIRLYEELGFETQNRRMEIWVHG